MTGSSDSVFSMIDGNLDQALHEAALALGIRGALLGQRDHEHAERGELRGECLGRRDADLRAARVSITSSDSRTSELSGTLQIASDDR